MSYKDTPGSLPLHWPASSHTTSESLSGPTVMTGSQVVPGVGSVWGWNLMYHVGRLMMMTSSGSPWGGATKVTPPQAGRKKRISKRALMLEPNLGAAHRGALFDNEVILEAS